MTAATATDLRAQLSDLRDRLETTIHDAPEEAHLHRLLREVDITLGRIGTPEYGVCEECHDDIGDEQIAGDPLARYCLGCLTPKELTALERDLGRTRELQGGLLPRPDLSASGWAFEYHYEPAGAVGGDFCDLIPLETGDTLFLLGDVSGKGIASSVLMAHLRAIFHSLSTLNLPAPELVGHANRVFCDFTMSVYFATLVAGLARPDGTVELVNAGHCPPLHFRRHGTLTSVEATGLPVGMFRAERYEAVRLELAEGDGLFLYTDGLSEARDARESEYGCERVARLIAADCARDPRALVTRCLADLTDFRGPQAERTDDLTVMVMSRL